ncbi:hypothetical protein Patl1_27731 [Pistacia atlantica]|uniref:Uncharacterized protein n=1 Tax=Pistacia atlantica TaxID=434234 RepID=A0ACC1BEU2_9ROSI|nr:hypothetical protein Patl1_27731 [Pistacia atlantica]
MSMLLQRQRKKNQKRPKRLKRNPKQSNLKLKNLRFLLNIHLLQNLLMLLRSQILRKHPELLRPKPRNHRRRKLWKQNYLRPRLNPKMRRNRLRLNLEMKSHLMRRKQKKLSEVVEIFSVKVL